MNIKDLPRVDRPREKLIAKGESFLKDKELLAILLRTGGKGRNAIELSEDLLKKYPQQNLLQASLSDLLSVKGVDKAKASSILAAKELMSRVFQKSSINIPSIFSAQDAIHHLNDISQYKKEYFLVVYLNTRNQIIQKEIISIGTINASIVHPREVFEPAIRILASQILIAHNHPSGDPTPSEADVQITKKLMKAGEILGIDVLDHIILVEKGYLSFKENKLLFNS